MKKLFALASMIVVVSVSAQDRYQSDRSEGRGIAYQQKAKEIKQVASSYQIKDFYKYDLSVSQKRKLEIAFESHQQDLKKAKQKGVREYAYYQSNFDKKIEKILSKKQFAQYKKDQLKGKGEIAYYQPQKIKKHR